MKIVKVLFFLVIVSCSDNSTSVEKNKLAKPDQPVLNTQRRKIISDSTNTLEPGIKNLELEFIIWNCSCANWITTEDRAKYYSKEQVEAHCFYIEPANPSLNLPDSVFQFDKNNIKVTGQFYVREDYPQGTTEIEEPQKKAKVFRYTKIEMINKKFVVN
jgi:hypothetical protein